MTAAMVASVGLDEERSLLYVDLILKALPDAVSRALQAMNPSNYEFQSEFARRYVSQGRAEGRAEGQAEGERRGRAELLEKLLVAKFGSLSSEARARLLESSPAELDALAERLLTARTLAEFFAE